MVDGLWASNSFQVSVVHAFKIPVSKPLQCLDACMHAQVGDFKTVVFRQQLLGFNAVRLPFTFSDLSLTPRNFTVACVDDTAYIKVMLLGALTGFACAVMPVASPATSCRMLMQGNLSNPTAPYSSIDYSSLAFPAYAPPVLAVCNADLPNDSTLHRFLWVIQYYSQMVSRPFFLNWSRRRGRHAIDSCPLLQGFYVLVDYHASPGDTTVASGNLVSDWTTLWQAIVNLPNFSSELAGRVFLDLINEPDGISVRCAAHPCSCSAE